MQPIIIVHFGPAGQSSFGDLRLIDLSGSAEGRVGRLEICYDGQWGTVCDDNFQSKRCKSGLSSAGVPRLY